MPMTPPMTGAKYARKRAFRRSDLKSRRKSKPRVVTLSTLYPPKNPWPSTSPLPASILRVCSSSPGEVNGPSGFSFEHFANRLSELYSLLDRFKPFASYTAPPPERSRPFYQAAAFAGIRPRTLKTEQRRRGRRKEVI
uniref:Uncharacterized protein n=1 Tax=Myoviridae sp. ctPkm1 TaxID=2825099 RepID=A0A8S5TYC7_9CAUD|nr:MAG TPA: hypothetical protein [Myoviridae sp. ctPkm1]